MKISVARIAMMSVTMAIMAGGAWADEVPEPIGDAGEGLPMAVKAIFCLLPAIGAWCLYRVIRKRT